MIDLKFISKVTITFQYSKKIIVNELNLKVNEFTKHPNSLFLHELLQARNQLNQ